MIALVVALSAAAGLVAGWFVPLVAYRFSVPAEEPLRSRCENCDRSLGWIALRARCPQCGRRWGPPAWLTGASAALACALVAYALGPVAVLPLYLALCVLGVLLAAVDIACQRLPHGLVVPAIGVSALGFTVIAAITGEGSSLLRAGLGTVLLGGLYLVLFLVARGGFGFGDVKLAVLLGMFLGWLSWGAVLLGALLPSLVNAPVLIALLVARRVDRRGSVPFGPAMLTGAAIAIAVSGWVHVIGRSG